jgi:hypothetical protein
MRTASRLLRAVAVLLAALPLPIVRAEAPPAEPVVPPSPPLFFAYQSAPGPGVLSLQDIGPDEGTGGRQIRATLTQNGYCYSGSGTTLPLEQTPPYTTLITFTLVKLRGPSLVFQGKMISGITVSGQGTYHRAGQPEKKVGWSIVLGPAPSGIRGGATAGPIFPHEIPGVENRRPLANALLIIQSAQDGKEVARQRTDANGRFQIPLPPGAYRVVPLPPNPKAVLPRAEPFKVSVQQGEFPELVIDYETGIR